MGPKSGHISRHRGIIRATQARRAVNAVFALVLAGAMSSPVYAGDILRGGATRANDVVRAQALANTGQAQALKLRANAQDRLARTTQALQNLHAAQAAARAAAANANHLGMNPLTGAPLPVVPDGLGAGGLDLDRVVSGAKTPVQSGNTVTVEQTAAQAMLHWKTFNVGRNTTLNFDQSAGGADAGKWIAFNKVTGADHAPSQILGRINAQGQVYVLNQNGIIFGGASQINTRSLVASSLPINDNLVRQGLLNNRDAQFIFSSIEVPGGSDGTPSFVPPAPPPGGVYGDVTVQRGAQIRTSVSAEGGGGRVMLVGPNVRNEGTIETPSGQTILAAGNQVGIAPHSGDDPSLRGLDVWVGRVEDGAGSAVNSGVIAAMTGSITMAGKRVTQAGALESSTSVALNGRIDLLASYGAVANPNYDNSGSPGYLAPLFFNQFTGVAEFVAGSVARILPHVDGKRIPGTRLPERSRANVEGMAVHFGPGSILMAPSGEVSIRAGSWPYRDTAANGTIFDGTGAAEPGIANFSEGGRQRFFHDRGQVYFDAGSLVDVSGTTTAFVPLGQSVVEVTLRGNELADSPLLRESSLRGIDLTVDLRQSGDYFGRYWVGTPLGDLTGILNVIERDVAQLTAAGGDITVRAGESIVQRRGATLDVSGGVLQHEGGFVRTTRLQAGRQLFDMREATPDKFYDNVYSGYTVPEASKWGGAGVYAHPLAPLGGTRQDSYLSGAPGGNLGLTAASMVLDGTLTGRTTQGPGQLETAERGSALALRLLAQKRVQVTENAFYFIDYSPTPPAIRLQTGRPGTMAGIPEFVLAGDGPAALPSEIGGNLVLGSALFEEEEGGFSDLSIDNREGSVTLSGSGGIVMRPSGRLAIEATVISVTTGVKAPGGRVSLIANNYSPFLLDEQTKLGTFDLAPAPAPLAGKGSISLTAGAGIDVAGQLVDHRRLLSATPFEYAALDGGSITLRGYSISLPSGSSLAASGGFKIDDFGDAYAGLPGDISIIAGRDPVLSTSVGGDLVLQARLSAFGATAGGSLAIQANRVQIGGTSSAVGGLFIPAGFFQQGGFGDYRITGIGARDAAGEVVPGLQVAAGTVIEPLAASLSPRAFPRLALEPRLLPAGLRPAASITLEAAGADDAFTTALIEAPALLTLGEGSRIKTDPLGSVSVKGDVVMALGTIVAPGGRISLQGGSAFAVPDVLADAQSLALPTVYLGAGSRLSAAGTSVLLPDVYGRRAGILHDGGEISLDGNIVAEAGAVLDVSGASASLDFHPSRLGLAVPRPTAGLTAVPSGQQAARRTVFSDAGAIRLAGSEMLYSDATLIGSSGGSDALGGTLAVSSGRFYRSGSTRHSAEINLIVDQSGRAFEFGDVGAYGDLTELARFLGTGSALSDLFSAGSSNPGMGYFSLAAFSSGRFGSLDLGYEYRSDARPIPYGGNVRFRGDVDIAAPGFVRVAGGGVIEGSGRISINAPYVAIGREFQAPLAPGQRFQPFSQVLASGGTGDYFLPPVHGAGSLNIGAALVDIGTVSLQGIGTAELAADRGDIRGNGTLNIAGDLTLRSAQIYPTTLASFDIFAYDSEGATGSVTVTRSGSAAAPLSAGGSLRIFAADIGQEGTLRAPLGSIVLGWDGRDLNPTTPSIDGPQNAISGLGAQVTRTVSLSDGSTTSVSAGGLTIPFGLSPDGLSWIDPRGVDVTLGGLPERGVTLAGEEVNTGAGSLVDLRGGGDLLAYRWIPGTGGSADLLGSAGAEWGAGGSYEAGDLVSFRGRTYSARVSIDPDNFSTAPGPGDGRYWKLVPESYAVIPGFGSSFAPFAPFNSSATLLGGDPGYVAGLLRLGEQFVSPGGGDLPAGSFALLPSRFALLPGAYLVRPIDGTISSGGLSRSSVSPFLLPGDLSVDVREDGVALVEGQVFNNFHRASAAPAVRRLFELMTPALVAQQARYDVYSADSFMVSAATRQNAASVQRLPRDAAPLVMSGNAFLSLAGTVRASGSGVGRAADIDVASAAAMRLVGGAGAAVPGSVNLDADLMAGWGSGSLLVGGVRRTAEDGSTVVDVRTDSLALDNPGSALRGADVALVSGGKVELTRGSKLAAAGSGGGGVYRITGEGAALRASSANGASIVRQGAGASVAPLLLMAPDSSVTGAEVVLDSTYGMNLDDSTALDADRLSLAAGQISLVLSSQGTLAGGTIDPHLVLAGDLLSKVQQVDSLNLSSYGSVDVYGDGQFGRAGMELLSMSAAGLRGYAQTGAGASFVARNIILGNASSSALPSVGPAAEGSVAFTAGNVVGLGAGEFALRGFREAALRANAGLTVTGSGSLVTDGDLRVTAPLVTGGDRADYSLEVGGDVAFLTSPGATAVLPGLGATLSVSGRSVTADNLIDLPGGLVSLRATGGDVNVGGAVRADGRAVAFHDLTRFAEAGRIALLSENGNVRLAPGSLLTADGAAGGGDAGTVLLSSPRGEVFAAGIVQARAGGADARAGSFVLDAGALASYADLRDTLSAGGFTESQSHRLRSGSIVLDGNTQVRDFSLAADSGDITVSGTIDASGETGGRISLVTSRNLTLADGSVLTVAAEIFSNAGKGGQITLEAGSAINGVANTAALLDLRPGSRIDLSVGEYVAGSHTTPGSSASRGQFEGTLHLRAPRTDADVRIASLGATIHGGSSVLAEAFRVYQPSGGVMNTSLRNLIHADNNAFFGTAGTAGANETAIRSRLLAGSSLDPDLLVIAPGVEIANLAGDLVLGLANPSGATSTAARNEAFTAADWDLSGWRYGSDRAPGVLTLRASGDLVFNNALSDGFTPVSATVDNGWSRLWLAPLTEIKTDLPLNTQSWSYRLTAGADLAGASTAAVLPDSQLSSGKGSVLVGEFYPHILNTHDSGTAAGQGLNGQTADSVRIVSSSRDTTERGTRYEVIRTGTGDITIHAGREVQLRNQFASIYSAGVALPDPTHVFQAGDFTVPSVNLSDIRHPGQGNLGANQQRYSPQWALGGGDIRLSAQGSIRRVTEHGSEIVPDSTRQLPSNWLYRRGFVDPATGKFSSAGGVDGGGPANVTDAASSTAWWIDYSNFFQGIGALGGGDIALLSGGDLVNIDAVIPTTARMAGRNPATGETLQPDAANLLEFGGGNLTLRTGGDISGGVYHVERGKGDLFAGGEINSNPARSPSLYLLGINSEDPAVVLSRDPSVYDPLTWLPTTLFAGDAAFRVTARGDVLLGPVANASLLPQGLNNKFWYKTYFHTYSPDASVDVLSIGGSVTHRQAAAGPSGGIEPVLGLWLRTQNLFTGVASVNSASHFQPWLRLAEADVAQFYSALTVLPPTMRSTAFAGDVNLVGDFNLFPSRNGTLELASSGAIFGLRPVGRALTPPTILEDRAARTVWASASVNLSDAPPSSLPSLVSPLAYQSLASVGRDLLAARSSTAAALTGLDATFAETGSFSGVAGSVQVQRALHDPSVLHRDDSKPLRAFAMGGDISGFTLFSAKQARILAATDITDVAFYLQNNRGDDVSIVAAGRDIVPNNAGAPLRVLANNLVRGNYVDPAEQFTLVDGSSANALAGDIQVSGPGLLQVLAGRNIDLGTGANRAGGIGVGITSIGNLRNPFLEQQGAGLVAVAGARAVGGGPALGLSASSLNFSGFFPGDSPVDRSPELAATAALDSFYAKLKSVGQKFSSSGSYDEAYAAITEVFGATASQGELLTRSRDIRTVRGGDIRLAVPGGGITMASSITGNPLAPPGIVTEYGGSVSILTDRGVAIGRARIFSLRGGDITIWASNGDIAAGSAPRTVVTAPPTRVVVDTTSADVLTDLGGLATGGGIGSLQLRETDEASDVVLIAPRGTVDAGDAGIRATGNIAVAAAQVLNADNIAASGTSAGVPAAAPVAAPNVSGLSSPSTSTAATSSAAQDVARQAQPQTAAANDAPSVITVEVLGYGGGASEDEDAREARASSLTSEEIL